MIEQEFYTRMSLMFNLIILTFLVFGTNKLRAHLSAVKADCSTFSKAELAPNVTNCAKTRWFSQMYPPDDMFNIRASELKSATGSILSRVFFNQGNLPAWWGN